MRYILAGIMAFALAGCLTQASESAPVGKPVNAPIVTKCKADLAKRFEMQARDIKVIEAMPTTWPDASLGMPESGKMYAQVLTPGFKVILEAKGTRYLYTASAKTFRYGGPASAWSCSLLYLKRAPNEPNMNGDLYQCSLLGTNSVRVASGVDGYYPQEKGMVIFTRRTSRSGCDLLYVKADGKSKAVTLHSALAFGDAAISGDGKQWAGFVMPGLGSGWNVTIGRIDRKSKDRQVLPLPDGISPERIAWSGDDLMILAKKGERTTGFEIAPKAEKPEWKEVAYHLFPGPDYMLSKSESLVIEQVTGNGKPAVKIATVWFTGDETLIARIEDFTMRGQDFIGGRYAFVWGDKGSKPAAYTVDIATGEIIPGPRERDIKPFLYPPRSNPTIQSRPK